MIVACGLRIRQVWIIVTGPDVLVEEQKQDPRQSVVVTPLNVAGFLVYGLVSDDAEGRGIRLAVEGGDHRVTEDDRGRIAIVGQSGGPDVFGVVYLPVGNRRSRDRDVFDVPAVATHVAGQDRSMVLEDVREEPFQRLIAVGGYEQAVVHGVDIEAIVVLLLGDEEVELTEFRRRDLEGVRHHASRTHEVQPGHILEFRVGEVALVEVGIREELRFAVVWGFHTGPVNTGKQSSHTRRPPETEGS